MKIYVGNLSFDTTQDGLQSLFEPFGAVSEVSVITDRETGRPRGFAFITMDDEGANKAIADLNGKDHGGRTLTVSEAKPREPRSGGGGFRGGSGGGGGGGGRRW